MYLLHFFYTINADSFEDHGFDLLGKIKIGNKDNELLYVIQSPPFQYVSGFALDKENTLYVLDTGNNRIAVFDRKLKWKKNVNLKEMGIPDGIFITDIKIDLLNNIYLFAQEDGIFKANDEFEILYWIQGDLLFERIRDHANSYIVKDGCVAMKTNSLPVNNNNVVLIDDQGELVRDGHARYKKMTAMFNLRLLDAGSLAGIDRYDNYYIAASLSDGDGFFMMIYDTNDRIIKKIPLPDLNLVLMRVAPDGDIYARVLRPDGVYFYRMRSTR